MRLSRWIAEGSTQGVWLLRDYPGVVVERFRGQWVVRLVAPQQPTEWSLRVWGEEWVISSESLSAVAGLKKGYPTRGEALLALELALSRPVSSLKGML